MIAVGQNKELVPLREWTRHCTNLRLETVEDNSSTWKVLQIVGRNKGLTKKERKWLLLTNLKGYFNLALKHWREILKDRKLHKAQNKDGKRKQSVPLVRWQIY